MNWLKRWLPCLVLALSCAVMLAGEMMMSRAESGVALGLGALVVILGLLIFTCGFWPALEGRPPRTLRRI